MTERVQLAHLLIDVNFDNKPTIRAFRRKFGHLAEWWLVKCLMQMSQATMGRIPDDVALDIAESMGLSNAEQMIEYCLKAIDEETNHTIFSREKGLLTNSRVIKDQESCALKRKKSKDRQLQYRDKRVTNALLTRDPDTDIDTDTVTDTDLDHKNSDPPHKPIPQTLILDDFQKDAALKALLDNGLKTEELARRLFILQGYYAKNPHKYRASAVIYDICAPWVSKAMLDENAAKLNEEAAQKRLERAQAGSSPQKQTEEQEAEMWKKFHERREQEKKQVNGRNRV